MFGEDEVEGSSHSFGDFNGFRELRAKSGTSEVRRRVLFDGCVGGGLVEVGVSFSFLCWFEGGEDGSAPGGGRFGW